MKPTPQELYELRVVQGLSPAVIAHRYGRVAASARRWLCAKEYKEYVPPVKTQDEDQSKAVLENEPQAKSGEETFPIAIPEILAEPSAAYDRLTERQKRAVMFLTDLDTPMTITEIAKECGINVQTLIAWKKLPDFQEAIKELLVPLAKSEFMQMLPRRLLQLMQAKQDKPEDRKLLAEITGLIGGDGLTVNVGVITAPSHLTNRWK